MIRRQKVSIPAPNVLPPTPVLMIDYKHEKRRPSLPAPDSAFREFMTSRAT